MYVWHMLYILYALYILYVLYTVYVLYILCTAVPEAVLTVHVHGTVIHRSNSRAAGLHVLFGYAIYCHQPCGAGIV